MIVVFKDFWRGSFQKSIDWLIVVQLQSEVSKQTRSKMNEGDLHLAQAMVEMGLEDQPQTPKKTIVSRVQEKVQGFRWVDRLFVA